MIRLLIVEDSKTVQKALVASFEADPQIKVVGVAETGEAAVELAESLRPDIITMDINLPGMDGFQATRAIMSSCPTPIVIVTGKLDPKDSGTLFRVMEAGALMVLGKPAPVGSPEHAESVARLVQHIKLMAEIKVVRRTFVDLTKASPPPPPAAAVRIPLPRLAQRVRVVAIGASTGGPPLLRQILSALPTDFAPAVLVVQHMADGFTESFAAWLNEHSTLPVRLAEHGMAVLPGQVLVAPDGYHLEVAGDRVVLSRAALLNGVRPSASALFRSLAACCGENAVGVLLTGMGTDGAAELKLIREKGGITIAQDRESSVVFGMPGEAVRLGAASYILPPQGIIELLKRVARGIQVPGVPKIA